MLELILVPLVSAVIGAVVSLAFNAFVKKSTDNVESQKAMFNGVKTLLRNELVEAHREYVEQDGCISLESLEYVEDTYNAYHAMKGNGSGTKLWEDIKALPIKD